MEHSVGEHRFESPSLLPGTVAQPQDRNARATSYLTQTGVHPLPPRFHRAEAELTGGVRQKERPDRIGAFLGADGGTRTPDPIITSDVLYQLSYVGSRSLAVRRAGHGGW